MKIMNETRKNNPIGPNLEKTTVPWRSGDDIRIKDPKTPSGDKLTDDKKLKASIKPEKERPNLSSWFM